VPWAAGSKRVLGCCHPWCTRDGVTLSALFCRTIPPSNACFEAVCSAERAGRLPTAMAPRAQREGTAPSRPGECSHARSVWKASKRWGLPWRCHPVGTSTCHPISVSTCHPVSASMCHPVGTSTCCPISTSMCRPISTSMCHLVSAPMCHPVPCATPSVHPRATPLVYPHATPLVYPCATLLVHPCATPFHVPPH